MMSYWHGLDEKMQDDFQINNGPGTLNWEGWSYHRASNNSVDSCYKSILKSASSIRRCLIINDRISSSDDIRLKRPRLPKMV